MICPKCNAEYREGFYLCADCNVPLVSSHAPFHETEHPESGELVPVLDTQDSVYLSEVISVIEEWEVPYLLQSGTAFDLENSGRIWRAVLYVPGTNLDQVKQLIDGVRSGVVRGSGGQGGNNELP
jgi:hypothetical protein